MTGPPEVPDRVLWFALALYSLCLVLLGVAIGVLLFLGCGRFR